MSGGLHDAAGRLSFRDPLRQLRSGRRSIVPALERVTAWNAHHCDLSSNRATGTARGTPRSPLAPDRAAAIPPALHGRSPTPGARGRGGDRRIRPVDPVSSAPPPPRKRPWEPRARRAERRRVRAEDALQRLEGNPGADAFVRSWARRSAAPEFVVDRGRARRVRHQGRRRVPERGYGHRRAGRDLGRGLEPEEVTLARWAERGGWDWWPSWRGKTRHAVARSVRLPRVGGDL